jgi:serine/threonine-protein kinase RCK2
MPSKVGLKFSFFFPTQSYTPILDLIRHGKNHIHVRQGQDDFHNSQQPAAPTTDARSQPERRQQAEPQPQSQSKQQQSHKVQAAAKQSQHITREVEKIVREEREAMDKMPIYDGLERFKLIEKKGECAIFTLYLAHASRLTDFLHSGAFSNVYKALDLTSGTYVAGTPFSPLLATLMSRDPLNFVSQSGSQVRTYPVTG